jgi:oligopeptide transport system substrate-binding protein
MKHLPNKGLCLLVLAILFNILFFACTDKGKTNVSQGTKNQILHMGNGTEPQDLDPHIVTGVPEHNIISALMEGLVSEDPKDLSPRPGMAESWSISKDQMTYTFKIRKDARWSNGDQLTSNDFVFSWRRILSPSLACEYAYMMYYLKNAKKFNKDEITDFSKVGVKAIDSHTLQVTLESPTPFFLSILSHFSTFPVHRQTIERFGAIDKRGTKWTRPGNHVGNGPFILKRWELNKIIVVEKNPLYWDAQKVRLNGINFYPVENQSTEERMFRSGQLHITSTLSSEKIAVYKEKNPELLKIVPYLGTYYYLFNTLKKPFDDPYVRRDFAMSIDRKKIVEKITKGGQIPAFSFTPPDTAGYTPKANIPFDIKGAKKLLSKAGYPDGKGFPHTEILYNTSEGHRKTAVVIQQMWKKALNIDVTLVNQDWKVYLNSRKTKDFYIARAGWIGDYADPNTFLDMFVTGGGNNHSGWSDAVYDDLIEKASETASREKRFEFFQEAEKILLSQAPIIPIYIYTNSSLIYPDVKGRYPNILDHHPYKYIFLSSEG